jgi:hypothetical protein
MARSAGSAAHEVVQLRLRSESTASGAERAIRGFGRVASTRYENRIPSQSSASSRSESNENPP